MSDNTINEVETKTVDSHIPSQPEIVEELPQTNYKEGSKSGYDSQVAQKDRELANRQVMALIDENEKATQAKMKAENLIEELENQYYRDPRPIDNEDEKSLLGYGSFGQTHRMRNDVDKLLYAVKVINIAQAENSNVNLKTLIQEAALLRQIEHEHIVRYFASYFSKQKRYFNLVMELIDGVTIDKKIKDESVTLSDIVNWWTQLANALNYMHYGVKIQHRDIKPGNILVKASDNKIKIIDFGFACILISQATKKSKVGTPAYYSYEKANMIPYDGRDDVWAAGCVVAELLTKTSLVDRGGGIFLFTNSTVNDRRLTLISDCVGINSHYGAIVGRMLEPEQENRCTAKELVELLASPEISIPTLNTHFKVYRDPLTIPEVSTDITTKKNWEQCIAVSDCHNNNLYWSYLNFDNYSLFTRDKDGTELKLWNISEKLEISHYVMPDKYFFQAGFMSPDSIIVVTNSFIGLLDMKLGTIKELYSDSGNIDVSTMKRFYCTEDGSIAYSRQGNGKIRVYDLVKGSLLLEIGTEGMVDDCDIDVNKQFLIASSDNNGIVKLWNISTGKTEKCFSGGHSGRVKSIRFNRAVTKIVSGSKDKTMIIWDIATCEILHRLIGHSDIIWNVCWSSLNDNIVLSASEDTTVKVWNSVSGELIQTLCGHSGSVSNVSISSDNSKIFTASKDKTIKLWM